MSQATKRERRFEGTCYIPGEQLLMMAKFYRGANLNLNLTLLEDDLHGLKETLENSCWCEKLNEVDRMKLQRMKGDEWRVLHDHCDLKGKKICSQKVDKCTSYSSSNLRQRAKQGGPRMVQFAKYPGNELHEGEIDVGSLRSPKDAVDGIQCAVCVKDVCSVCNRPLQGRCRCMCPVPNASLCVECGENPHVIEFNQMQAQNNDMTELILSLMNYTLFNHLPIDHCCSKRDSTSLSSSSSCSCEDGSVKKILLYDCDSTSSKQSDNFLQKPRKNIKEDDEGSNPSCVCCKCTEKSSKGGKMANAGFANKEISVEHQISSKGILKSRGTLPSGKTNYREMSENITNKNIQKETRKQLTSLGQSFNKDGKLRKHELQTQKTLNPNNTSGEEDSEMGVRLHQAGMKKDQTLGPDDDQLLDDELSIMKEVSNSSEDSFEGNPANIKEIMMCIPKIHNSLEQLLLLVSQKESVEKHRFQHFPQPQESSNENQLDTALCAVSSEKQDEIESKELIISGCASRQVTEITNSQMSPGVFSRKSLQLPGKISTGAAAVGEHAQLNLRGVLLREDRSDVLKPADVTSRTGWFTPTQSLLLSSSGRACWQKASFEDGNYSQGTEVDEEKIERNNQVECHQKHSSAHPWSNSLDYIQSTESRYRKPPNLNVGSAFDFGDERERLQFRMSCIQRKNVPKTTGIQCQMTDEYDEFAGRQGYCLKSDELPPRCKKRRMGESEVFLKHLVDLKQSKCAKQIRKTSVRSPLAGSGIFGGGSTCAIGIRRAKALQTDQTPSAPQAAVSENGNLAFTGAARNLNEGSCLIGLKTRMSIASTDNQFYKPLYKASSSNWLDDMGRIESRIGHSSTTAHPSEELPLLPHHAVENSTSKNCNKQPICSNGHHESLMMPSVFYEKALRNDKRMVAESSTQLDQRVLVRSKRQMQKLKTARDTIQTMIQNVNHVIVRMDDGPQQHQSFFVHHGIKENHSQPETKSVSTKHLSHQGPNDFNCIKDSLKKKSLSGKRSDQPLMDLRLQEVLKSVDRVINTKFSIDEIDYVSRKDVSRVAQGRSDYCEVLDTSSNSTVFTDILRRSLENEITSPNLSAAIVTSESRVSEQQGSQTRSSRPMMRRSWLASHGR